MPNDNRGNHPRSKGLEVISDAAQRPGADPLAVRLVRGAVTLGVPGYAITLDKIGVVAADEPTPNLHLPLAGQAADVQARFAAALRAFSGTAFFLEFVGGGNGAKASIDVYRALPRAGGETVIVADGTFADIGHHVLARDALMGGLATYYRIKSVTADGATAIKLHVAGEGLGYGE